MPAPRHHLAPRGSNALGITDPRRVTQSSETTQNKGTSTQIESKQNNYWQSLSLRIFNAGACFCRPRTGTFLWRSPNWSHTSEDAGSAHCGVRPRSAQLPPGSADESQQPHVLQTYVQPCSCLSAPVPGSRLLWKSRRKSKDSGSETNTRQPCGRRSETTLLHSRHQVPRQRKRRAQLLGTLASTEH